mgnify:FL=1|jgi:hypothetical protein
MPFEYGKIELSSMTLTFKCDNEKCKKTLVCILSKYDESEYFGRCEYCKSGRLKWIKNVDLFDVLKEKKIIFKLKRP